MMQIELKQIQENPAILETLTLENNTVIITQNNQPLYQLTKITQPKRRHRGGAKGLIKMSPDFDQPLPEFEEYTSDEDPIFGLGKNPVNSGITDASNNLDKTTINF
ncbi:MULTISPECIES: DUF2281 domain-containing protein [Planktothrix]|uniref:DUF2281 domain-containing protein n=1 Tax=Planktothrix TaxID=54304 RepID=UPI0003F4ECC8|nr:MULTISPECIES: DUF2281 domain-containing protein [Planktothrix]CAD5972258.1 hypothetical protein NO758_03843 [Planktothrix agardhii]